MSSPSAMPIRYLQMKALAEYLGLKPCYLYKLNTLGLGPKTVGRGRAKRSRTDWADEWIENRGEVAT